MSQKSKIIAGFGAIVIIGAALIGVSIANDQSQQAADSSSTPTSQQTKPENKSQDIVSYEGEDGKTALELLKATHEVETKTYEGMGEYVTAIDGKAPSDSSEFWAFYVDGKQAQVGAGEYATKDGEKIEWKLERIQ